MYFVDHTTRTTTFKDPRDELVDPASANVPQYQRNFKYKLMYFKEQHVRIDQSSPCKMTIQRSDMFRDSYNAVMGCDPATLRRRLYITFLGEEGLDYGGLAREWFFQLSHEILNPMYCLFEYADNGKYGLQINRNSGINPNHLDYFVFIGRFVAMAIHHGKFIDNGFTLPFYKQMLSRPLGLKDVESVDLEYFKSLMWIKENDIDECGLGLTFSDDLEVFGEVREHELKPGGKDIEVTDANKDEYLELIAKWRLTRGAEEQTRAFLKGFNEIVNLEHIKVFDEKELEMLLLGVADFDLQEWRGATMYRTYNDRSKQIVWFWQVVASFSAEQKARLLQFVTGSCRLPVGGFKELVGNNGRPQPFTIERLSDVKQLPRSHTCFNRLDLPAYKSFAELEKKLVLAIEETEGFSME